MKFDAESADLATMERHAYADGDTRTAALCAAILDRQQDIEELERADSLECQEQRSLADSLLDERDETARKLDELYAAIDDMPRCTKKAVLALVAEMFPDVERR